MLRDIQNESKTVHLLYTDSGKVDLMVYDTVKEKCGANLDSIFDVATSSAFNDMIDLVNVQPFLARKWMFTIEYKKVRKLCEKYKAVFKSENAEYLIRVSNYKEFLEVKDLVDEGLNQLYLTYIQKGDVDWLFRDFEIKRIMLDYISKSYARDPEKILDLLKEVQNGYQITDRKSITAVCGESSSSLPSFLLGLLTLHVNTEKGLTRSIGMKAREAVGLSRVYGVGKFRNYLMSTLKDIIYIKEMYLNGDIYDYIRDVPECFEEKKMTKYRIYYYTILKIPLENMVRLYVYLSETGYWRKEVDVVSFIYDYYRREVRV